MNEEKSLKYYNDIDARYEELIRLLESAIKSMKKRYRKVCNEPDSDEKFERMELMQFAINRVEQVYNWDSGIRKKVERKERRELEEMHKEQERLMRIKRAKETPKDAPLFNRRCRYFKEYITGNPSGNIGRRKWQECDLDIPMEHCSTRCAFASNMVSSTPQYDAPIEENHRRVRRDHE